MRQRPYFVSWFGEKAIIFWTAFADVRLDPLWSKRNKITGDGQKHFVHQSGENFGFILDSRSDIDKLTQGIQGPFEGVASPKNPKDAAPRDSPALKADQSAFPAATKFLKRKREVTIACLIELHIFGPRIQKFRMERGWSQVQFMLRLRKFGWDIQPSVLANIETGQRSLTDNELVLLLKALKKALSDLL